MRYGVYVGKRENNKVNPPLEILGYRAMVYLEFGRFIVVTLPWMKYMKKMTNRPVTRVVLLKSRNRGAQPTRLRPGVAS